MTKHKILSLFFLIFIFSCTFHENNELPTYTVSKGNFENTIVVDGFTEPLNSSNAACPPYIEGVVAFLVEDGTIVSEGEVVCIVEVQELQTNYDQLLINLENAEVGLNKTKADLGAQYALLEAQVKTNAAETEIARLDSLQLKYLTPNQAKIKELELERVMIDKERYEKKLKALAVIQQSEIRRYEMEMRQFESRVQAVKKQLDDLTVVAPKGGLAIRAIYPITRSKLQVGDPVWHLMPLVTIPELSEMKIKITAPEADYRYINIGDSVIYTFDAMPDNVAWGKITMKSPVGQQYKEGSKVKFFEIEASIDSTLKMPEPGFTANCRVILQQVKDTLVVPQIAVFEEDSVKVVYVKKKNNYEMRQVLTGTSSAKEVIITSGLLGDEIVSLAKPRSSLVKKKVLLPKEEAPVVSEEEQQDATQGESTNSEAQQNNSEAEAQPNSSSEEQQDSNSDEINSDDKK